jgi:hypothetical protein
VAHVEKAAVSSKSDKHSPLYVCGMSFVDFVQPNPCHSQHKLPIPRFVCVLSRDHHDTYRQESWYCNSCRLVGHTDYYSWSQATPTLIARASGVVPYYHSVFLDDVATPVPGGVLLFFLQKNICIRHRL